MAAEAGAEKVREGKERAQQRSAFREHDFDGGGDGDGGTPCRQARDVRARLGRCCVEGEFQQQPPQQLDGVALLGGGGVAMPPPPSVRTARRGASHYQHHRRRALHKLSAAARARRRRRHCCRLWRLLRFGAIVHPLL